METTLEKNVAKFKARPCYLQTREKIKTNLDGVYTWRIKGYDQYSDWQDLDLGLFKGTYEEAIDYAVMHSDFFGYGNAGSITLENPPKVIESATAKAKPYMVLPPTVRKFCWNYDGVIIGGYVKFLLGEAESAKDIDIIVPLHNWPDACRLVPTGSKSNCFGGFKFKESNIEVDVWPGDALQTLRDQYPKGVKAYCPKTSLVIKLEVV